MSNQLINKFIEIHYQIVNPQESRFAYLGFRPTQKHLIKKEKSVLIINEKQDKNNLELLVVNQSSSDYLIDLNQKSCKIKGYTYSQFIEYSNIFHITISANEKLYGNHRTFASPKLLIATLWGEKDKLNPIELQFYNEFMGTNLPIDILTKDYFSLKTYNKKDSEFIRLNQLLRNWTKNSESSIKIYDRSRNGPLHYYFIDNKP